MVLLKKATIKGLVYGGPGKTPSVKPRTTLGHEGIGIIEEGITYHDWFFLYQTIAY